MTLLRRACLLCATTSLLIPLAPAGAATPHTVVVGETLWSIAAAHNFTTRTVAAFNGLPEDAALVAGQTVQVPTPVEGEAALAATGIVPAEQPAEVAAAPAPDADAAAAVEPEPEPAAAETSVPAPAPGLAHVPSPWGELHLDPAAAESWNAMRAESLRLYGQDLHPNGPLSAHRSYEQQAGLYEQYLSGEAPMAAPPGSSAHELGTAVDVATPEMRWAIDRLGPAYGWGKVEAPGEWWHVNYAP
jgi:LysM repeat protein